MTQYTRVRQTRGIVADVRTPHVVDGRQMAHCVFRLRLFIIVDGNISSDLMMQAALRGKRDIESASQPLDY